MVQRLDGVKMLALAALAAAACAASRHGTLSPMSFLSLPLLLIWVAVLGAALGRR
ncbi:hypothetical protein [Streptomyces sp. NPDC087300]|uniref:hypothetical protein n=1 Tax=Streptomyces sp. NPDC087300 TaxID=3365780 RepID=UPI00382BF777